MGLGNVSPQGGPFQEGLEAKPIPVEAANHLTRTPYNAVRYTDERGL